MITSLKNLSEQRNLKLKRIVGLGFDRSLKGKLITIVSVAVAVIVAMATIQSTQASIDYWLQKPSTFVQGLNQITVYSRNGGGMDADFYLIIKFSNATFSTQTESPYTKVDDSTVKIKFVLHKEDAKEKTIYFLVNGTDQISITVTLEKASIVEFIKANDLYPRQLTYRWDSALQLFNIAYAE